MNELDAKVNEFALELAKPAAGRLAKAMAMGKAIGFMRQAITDDIIRQFIAPLSGSALGFLTDKDKDGGYAGDVLRECIVSALLQKVWLTGNEFNIISGKCYITQNGYRRKVREIPGLSNLKEIPGTPIVHNGSNAVRVLIECVITDEDGKQRVWQLLNEKKEPGRLFTVKVNAGMGPDAIIGKALRKALKATYEELTGTDFVCPDGEVGEYDVSKTTVVDVPAASSRTEALANALGAKPNGNGHASDQAAVMADTPKETLFQDPAENTAAFLLAKVEAASTRNGLAHLQSEIASARKAGKLDESQELNLIDMCKDKLEELGA